MYFKRNHAGVATQGTAADTNQVIPIDPWYGLAASAPAPTLTPALFSAAERQDLIGTPCPIAYPLQLTEKASPTSG